LFSLARPQVQSSDEEAILNIKCGLEPALNTSEQFARYLKEDIDKGEMLVKQAGLTE